MSRAERLAEKLLQDRELAKQREAARRASRREPAGLDNFGTSPAAPADRNLRAKAWLSARSAWKSRQKNAAL